MARYDAEARTQYSNSARKLSQLDSLASTTVAAPAPISTQGCSVGARPMANHGDMLSTCACHFGGFLGGLGRPLARMCRTPITTSTTPSAILTASAASDGTVAGLGGLLPVATTVTVTTTARDTSHPNTNAAPLRAPRAEGSTTRKAVSGSGLSVTARPISSRLRTTAFPPVWPRPAAYRCCGCHCCGQSAGGRYCAQADSGALLMARMAPFGAFTADAREMAQPGPVHRRLRRGDARTVPRHPDAQRAGGDRADHRRRHRYRLAVHADWDLRRVGGDVDLLGRQHFQAGGVPAAEQAGGLPGAADHDADDAEDAAVQPHAAAQAGDVPRAVRVVGHQQRLRPVDLGAVRLRGQPCPAVASQQVREQVQGRVPLVVPVGRALHDLGVRAEGRVVDERLAVDHSQVDPQLDAVGQGSQARRRVLAV